MACAWELQCTHISWARLLALRQCWLSLACSLLATGLAISYDSLLPLGIATMKRHPCRASKHVGSRCFLAPLHSSPGMGHKPCHKETACALPSWASMPYHICTPLSASPSPVTKFTPETWLHWSWDESTVGCPEWPCNYRAPCRPGGPVKSEAVWPTSHELCTGPFCLSCTHFLWFTSKISFQP